MEQPGLNPILKPFLSGWLVVEQSGHFLDENQKLVFQVMENPLCMDDHPAMISKMMGIAHTRLFLHFQGLDFFLTAKKLDHAIKKLIA